MLHVRNSPKRWMWKKKFNKTFETETPSTTAYNWLERYFLTILHLFKNLFNFRKWWWQKICAERFDEIRPFVCTFPLIRCEFFFCLKLSIKWFCRAWFWKSLCGKFIKYFNSIPNRHLRKWKMSNPIKIC